MDLRDLWVKREIRVLRDQRVIRALQGLVRQAQPALKAVHLGLQVPQDPLVLQDLRVDRRALQDLLVRKGIAVIPGLQELLELLADRRALLDLQVLQVRRVLPVQRVLVRRARRDLVAPPLARASPLAQ